MNKPRGGEGEMTAYLALGSNQGVRENFLRGAVVSLKRQPGVAVADVSPVYETPAHTLGGEAQPPFLNAVVKLLTKLAPGELLQVCLEIERAEGRVRDDETRWMPRTLDVDILLYGDTVVETDELKIPHPRMGDRRFVLRPLADIAPDVHVPPPFDATAGALLDRCEDQHEPIHVPVSLLEGA